MISLSYLSDGRGGVTTLTDTVSGETCTASGIVSPELLIEWVRANTELMLAGKAAAKSPVRGTAGSSGGIKRLP